MRLVFAVFVSALLSNALLAATDKAPSAQPEKPTPAQAKKQAAAQSGKPAAAQARKPAPPAPAKVIKPLEIPPGAVEGEPGRFSYTDAQGKKWIYARTPFGIARYEDQPSAAEAPKPVDPLANVKIVEEGDLVRFERPGPFGTYKWQKKRGELDEKEREAVTKARSSAARQESK